MTAIYHLAPRGELRGLGASLDRLRTGGEAERYVPAGLARDGFVHCTGDLATALAVANDYFAALAEPLVVLAIDPARLTAPVRFEAPAPLPGAGTEHLAPGRLFPHVYGPIELAAVTGAAVLPREGGRYLAPGPLLALDQVLPADPDPFPQLPAGSRLAQQVRFIAEMDRLKQILRRTVVTGSHRQENDAEHSWHLCLCVLILAEHANAPALDVLRALKMVIIHDLVEIDAGDTFAYDAAGMVGQHEREARAADRIFGLLPGDQGQALRVLWDEFEERRTPEARFAAAVDRFQPMLLNACTGGHAWRKHGITAPRVLERNAPMAEGSAALWEYAARMVAEAVAQGNLERG